LSDLLALADFQIKQPDKGSSGKNFQRQLNSSIEPFVVFLAQLGLTKSKPSFLGVISFPKELNLVAGPLIWWRNQYG
jgi:hypothetical protein